jgi:hypothetical protein
MKGPHYVLSTSAAAHKAPAVTALVRFFPRSRSRIISPMASFVRLSRLSRNINKFSESFFNGKKAVYFFFLALTMKSYGSSK